MKTRLFILLFALGSLSMIGQTKLADKFFDRFGYIKASELYEEAVKDGDSSFHVLTRLGDCYYNNSKSEDALKWYSAAANKYQNLPPDYMFKYIQTLKSVGKYEEADVWTAKLIDISSDVSKVEDYDDSNMDMYRKLQEKDDSRIVDVESLPFNSPNSDFGAYVRGNQLIFASGRVKEDDKKNKLYSWNEEPFLDIYTLDVSDKDGVSEYGEPDLINGDDLNTEYHEATVAISKDGNTMYFTRDNMRGKKRLDYDRKGTSHLKIYKATLNDTVWNDIAELPFNGEKFSTGHPALSPDGKTLYFVSDRDGGLGSTDIYSVAINDDGTYGAVTNAGEKINTPGREMFPFISKDSTFYFSSDGHFNLGLLDIFKTDILKDSNAEATNLGEPYNSGYDDFAFFVTDKEQGYFSSNRPGGKGSDDIYSFYSYECQQKINGIARDKQTNDILAGVLVRLIDETGKVVKEYTTKEDGSYEFDVDCNKKYTVVGTKDDYKEDMKEVVTDSENGKVNKADLYLEPLVISDQIVINPIFFDFDKWDIRTDAQYELENIVDVLRAHPNMVIKIESHTDSRGSDKYNEKLSDRRAKSTRDYIISRGIDANRIESAIGYGEYKLLNECADGVKCTKEQHQVNRRSYFYILKD
ncbi:WD40-like Beta Propeller Repeat [Flavobacteriaceae bacterium MAR_2010_188]|nr:WD40-like Beta Propeller Repeat [Flavobacteriaceae bacterium MAR_2010_188]